jgi:hypothetical protein
LARSGNKVGKGRQKDSDRRSRAEEFLQGCKLADKPVDGISRCFKHIAL